MIDLLLNFLLDWSNILLLIFNILITFEMCFIFHAWNEKWWKAIIPYYSTYIIYKHTWKKLYWIFFVQLTFDFLSIISGYVIRKNIMANLKETIFTYVDSSEFVLDFIDGEAMLLYILIFCIGSVITVILSRITYMKICDTLSITSEFLKVFTFLFPDLFILIDYVYYLYKKYQQKSKEKKIAPTKVKDNSVIYDVTGEE